MSLVFAIEPLDPIWDEIEAIAALQWAESDYNIHGVPINLDKNRYFQFNDLGIFLMFTAREHDALVGYAGMYLMPSMHTQTPLVSEDTLFLLPAYRKGRNGIRFYQYIEQEYRRIVPIVYPQATLFELSFTTKLTNGAGKLLNYLDFHDTAMQHLKTIHLTAVASDTGLAQTEQISVEAHPTSA